MDLKAKPLASWLANQISSIHSLYFPLSSTRATRAKIPLVRAQIILALLLQTTTLTTITATRSTKETNTRGKSHISTISKPSVGHKLLNGRLNFRLLCLWLCFAFGLSPCAFASLGGTREPKAKLAVVSVAFLLVVSLLSSIGHDSPSHQLPC